MNGETLALRPIAHIRSPFTEKFGIPRQSGLVEEVSAQVAFEEGFRAPEAFRGMEGFSHLWLLWGFSQTAESGVVADSAAAPAGGKPAHGGVCHPFPLPP